MLDVDKIEILHDHYKETCALAIDSRRSRDRSSLFVLCSLVVVLFERSGPGEFGEFVSSLVEQTWPGVVVDLRYASTLAWGLTLGLVVRYFQVSVYLERQYGYAQGLESLLAQEFPQPAFTREGTSYLTDYPLYSWWVHVLWRLVVPLAILAVAVWRILSTLSTPDWGLRLWFDFTLSTSMLATVILYAASSNFFKNFTTACGRLPPWLKSRSRLK